MPHPELMSIRRLLTADVHDGDRCQLCGAAVDPAAHRHVLQARTRELQCACVACHMLFRAPSAGGGHWRAVPDRWVALDGRELWDAIDAPVGLFFVTVGSTGAVTVRYPGPAGIVEAAAALASWDDFSCKVPALRSLEPETEAVLVREPDGAAAEAYIVPLDACFELAGLLRRSWAGHRGGPTGPQALEAFFARIRVRADRSPR